LDPWADTTPGVVPPETCRDIIKAAEQHGYPLEADSIDRGEVNNKLSQQIDIVESGKVRDGVDELWKLIEPILSRVTEIVQATKEKVWGLEKARQKASTAEWIFLRKYAPSTERNMLRLHQDSNMFTVNLFLNDDYDGGGLFYVRPPVGLGYEEHTPSIPSIPEEWYSYDWLAKVKRENTTALRFPDLKQGDLLIHNYTVWHAVAPLEQGVKYSLLFFFDMDNPEMQSIHSRRVDPTFINHATKGIVDLVWVNDLSATPEEVVVYENMEVGKEYSSSSYSGYIWRGIRREDGMILAEFTLELDRIEPYYIYDEELEERMMKIKYINLVQDGTIDLFWLHPITGDLELSEEAMAVGVIYVLESFEGHVMRAIRREDGKMISQFTILDDHREEPYMISDFDEDNDSQGEPSDVVFINHVSKGTMDLFWLNPDTSELSMLSEDMPVSEPITLSCYSGHVFRAIRREDNVSLGEFIVDTGVEEPYKIFDFEESFEIEFVNYAKDGTIDLFWLEPDNGEMMLLEQAMPVGESISNVCHLGHILQAIRREDKKFLAQFHIDGPREMPCEIFDPTDPEDEFHFPDSTEVDTGDDEL
jgi:cytidylate kinase